MKSLINYVSDHAAILFIALIVVSLFIGAAHYALGPVTAGYGHIANPMRP
jgi:hypothetical protein